MKNFGAVALLWSVAAGPVLLAGPLEPGIFGVFSEGGRTGPVAAPGSVILILSSSFQVGPAQTQLAPGFPLVTSLAGTSVRITVGATSVNAYVLATEANWVRALVPSGTPLGDGQLVVTYNGRSSATFRLTLVERQFGLYNGEYVPPGYYAPSFFLPRSVQNIATTGLIAANTSVAPARPGEFVKLWGTGLGAAPGDEASAPIPGDLQIPGLQVMVGNQQARLIYAGRSGCCAGMDEVIFEVPPGVEGCNVPVWVRFAGDGSGTESVLVSIASGSGACSDPHGLSESEVRAAAAGNLKAALIDVYNSPLNSSWLAGFGQATPGNAIPLGMCTNRPWGASPSAFDLAPLQDAGSVVNIAAAGQSRPAKRTDDKHYATDYDGPLVPGDYVLDNGPGGADVGPFRIALTVPQDSFSWILPRFIAGSQLKEGFSLSWSGTDADSGYVAMWGQFAIDGETCGGCGFYCIERADKGSFTVPGTIAQLASGSRGEPNGLSLYLWHLQPQRLSVPGFDIVEFSSHTGAQRTEIDVQ